MYEFIFAIIGAAVGVMSISLAIIAARRSSIQDHRNDGERDGVLLTEIGYVKSGVDDIKQQQRRQEENHLKMTERVVAVEQSAKQAHHRIDKLEGGGGNRDNGAL